MRCFFDKIYNRRIPILLLLLLCAAVLFTSCGSSGGGTETAGSAETPASAVESPAEAENNETEESVRILIGTDMHYLDQSLWDDGELFRTTVENGDGKIPEYSDEVMEDFVQTVLQEAPDYCIIPGDLTYNGEQISLEHLIPYFQKIEDGGVPVLVIPGNHDIDNKDACRYQGTMRVNTEVVSKRGFRKACKEFGLEEAVSSARDSFSYRIDVNDRLSFLMLDGNTVQDRKVTSSTLKWAEKELAAMQEEGRQVITVTHQTLLAMNPKFVLHTVMSNNDEVAELLRKYGVETNISGHVHGSFIRSKDGLTDYAVGSLMITPLMYSEMTVSPEGEIEYERKHLEILQDEAEERMRVCTLNQGEQYTSAIGGTEEEKEVMKEFFLKLNGMYFRGELDEENGKALREEEGWELWKEYGSKTFIWLYMNSMFD